MNTFASLFYAIILTFCVHVYGMNPTSSFTKVSEDRPLCISGHPELVEGQRTGKETIHTDNQLSWLSLPQEIWTSCIAQCESKNNLSKTCTWLHNFISENKEAILTNEFLRLNPQALNKFFIYYGTLGKTAIVANLLLQGANPNLCDNEGNSLMHYAARYGYNDIASLLLKHPTFIATNIAKGEEAPLYLAMKYNQNDVVQNILSSCTINHGNALCYAAEEGLFNSVQTLLAHNIDINFQNQYEHTPLCYAAKKGNIIVAKLLIDNDAEVNSLNINSNPLWTTIGLEDQAIMTQLLLEHGADVNKKRGNIITPLVYASQHRYNNVITVLLHYGAYIDEPTIEIAKNDVKQLLINYKKTETNPLKLDVLNLEKDMLLALDKKTLEQLMLYHGALGNCAIVDNLLSCGVDPNVRDNNMSLMHYAAQYGYVDMVTILLKHPNFDKTTVANNQQSPLCLAAKHGQLDVIKHIINACTETINKEKALCYAVREGLFAVVDTLLTLKIDPNSANNKGEFPLWHAASLGDTHLPIMQLLIAKGANVNKCIETCKEPHWIGSTTLHFAAILEREHTAQLLINNGADVTIKTARGITPLHAAADAGNLAIVELLISRGADVNEKDNEGKTALHYAIKNTDTIALLLACPEINVNERDNNGNTPLHNAVEKEKTKTIQNLLDHPGIIINAQNNEQKTPLDATDKIQRWYYDEGPGEDQSNRKKIQQLLIKHGGKKHKQFEHEALLEKCKDTVENCVVQ